MTQLTPHFKASEFACRCGRKECDAAPMDKSFLEKLEALRVEWGKPLFITSGSRCAYWNKEVGGAPGSQHMQGVAADVSMPQSKERKKFAALAEARGFSVGRGQGFVHVDTRKGVRISWIYGQEKKETA